KSAEAVCIIRRSKGFVLVGDNLYKRSAFGILMKCVTLEEGKDILKEIHEGVCGNHAASRTLVSKAYRSCFFWPTTVSDAEDLVRRWWLPILWQEDPCPSTQLDYNPSIVAFRLLESRHDRTPHCS